MSALRLINETTAIDGVTSVNVTDVFSADFDIYKIVANVDTSSITAVDVNLRLLNSSGSPITSGVYDRAFLRMRMDTAFSEGRATNETGALAMVSTADQNPEGGNTVIWVFNPFSSSSYTFFLKQGMNAWSSVRASDKWIQVAKTTTSCTGFQFYVSSSGIGEETIIRTYGLRVDS